MAPHISKFVYLIHTANQVDSFEMVGPEQLDECPTSIPPAITLSGAMDMFQLINLKMENVVTDYSIHGT